MSQTSSLTYRTMQPADVDAYLGLVTELANYEKMADQVKATAADITRDFFSETPQVEALLAFNGDEAVGYGVFHPIYSTFRDRHGLYIEDVYMKPEFRGGGAGKRMMAEICSIALERGWDYSKFVTLNWNEPTLAFNRKLGAEQEADWVLHCLPQEGMQRLVDSLPSKQPAP